MTEERRSQGLHGSNTPEPWAEGKAPCQGILWMENPLEAFTLENTFPSCLSAVKGHGNSGNGEQTSNLSISIWEIPLSNSLSEV